MTMKNLFNRAMVFSDIHFGRKHNSDEHNQDCMDFIDWLIHEGKSRNAETCLFLGDWNHHRSNINLLTLDYTMRALRKLNNAFNKTYILVGNHDIFFREKRDIHSMVVGSEFQNIVLIEDPSIIDNVAFVPWLVEDEWKSISSMKSKYLFGHLELPGFKMNAMIDMPDHGGLNEKHFPHQDYVFSGHFHKRQFKGKVNYIGNPFGHNYADIWDFDRGAMFIQWDNEPEYINYEAGPRYININLSSLLANPTLYLKPKTYLQVILDVELTYEEATFLREELLSQYLVREFKLIKNNDEIETDYAIDVTLKTVDSIVVDQLSNIDSESFDNNTLIEIYNNL